ncbi:Metallo-dependent phosphatase-like protein [Umbelopsis sp. AD052]|nr:Metallo-dependent phosphatase-like protein [Umbelopsis sp. AD052]
MAQKYRCSIVHFNDVYHVSSGKSEPIGGAARFTTAIRDSRQHLESKGYADPMVLFSGDVFSPSTESSITRGKHMPAVLNQFSIDVACAGNHDFDFGVPQLQKLLKMTNFPWLLSNVLDKNTNSPPIGLKRHLVLNCKTSGLRIGVIGLVEKEWIDTIPSFPPELEYHDFVEVAKEMSSKLRDPNGEDHVDLVVALTHMRVPNDIKLANECQKEIDLALGGHDHFYYISKGIDIVGDTWTREKNVDEIGYDPEEDIPASTKLRVVKSGTDFRELSEITMDVARDENGACRIDTIQVTRKPITADVAVDEETEKLVDDIGKTVSAKTEYAIGYTLEALDGRSSAVRTKETNLGNLTSDLMMNAYNSVIGQVDAAFCCGGTFRSDKIHGPGPITLGDILDIFPYEDPVVVIKVTGQQLWDALENSVSEYPKQEGRFPQLAGIRIEWNPSAEPNKRLRKVHMVVHSKQGVADYLESSRSSSPFDYEPAPIRPNQERYNLENMVPLDLQKDYYVATRAYMADGYDGFHSLNNGAKNVLIDDEQGLIISTLYRKFFLGLKYVNALQDTLSEKHHHDEKVQAIVASVAHKWRNKAAHRTESSEPPETKALRHCTTAVIRKAFTGSIRGHPECVKSESDDEEDDEVHPTSDSHWVRRWASIAPTVDGRIITVDD